MGRSAKRKTNGGHTNTMKVYGSYVFKDKDPAIAGLQTLIERHYGKGVKSHGILTDISNDGGPSVSCMRAWFFGDTMRPQNPTIEAAGRAMGYERQWQRMRENKKGGNK